MLYILKAHWWPLAVFCCLVGLFSLKPFTIGGLRLFCVLWSGCFLSLTQSRFQFSILLKTIFKKNSRCIYKRKIDIISWKFYKENILKLVFIVCMTFVLAALRCSQMCPALVAYITSFYQGGYVRCNRLDFTMYCL